MRTFILAVGTQKAGTTWLFKQLFQSENFIKGLAKEYHLFDALYLGHDSAKEAANIARRVGNNAETDNEGMLQENIEMMKSFYQDEKKYFDYIDSILINDADFTADITPSYSGLPSYVLAKIKDEFNQRGISVKVVFLMREPISRIESKIKMGLKRSRQLHDTNVLDMTRKIHNSLNSTGDLLRSNYSYTCQQIDEVFSAKDVFYGFYETLFSETEIKRLSEFLNMHHHELDGSKVFNSAAKHFKYPLEEVEKFKQVTQDRYQFVSDRFDFDLSVWDDVVSNMVEERKLK